MHIPIAGKDGIMTIVATRFVYELFQFIFSFYFISAEALKAIKVHVMHVPLPWTKTSRTLLAGTATWFIYVYTGSFNM